MTRLRRPLAALAVLLWLGACAPARAEQPPDSIAPLVARLIPAVVNITTPIAQPGKPGQPANVIRRYGTGFLVHPSGIIVTNRHVVMGALDYFVTLNDGRRFHATVVAVAEGIDLAVMKISSDKPFPVVKIGDSSTLKQGDRVVAIGNPLGWSSTVTSGIVSALDRNIGSGRTDAFIQTDATINQGNSGGPMFNMDGEVVGVNSAIYTTEQSSGSIGIGFAIPINDARWVVQQLLKFGHIEPAWIGAEMQAVDFDLADSLGMTGAPAGGLIAQVTPGGPAAQAGLVVGDTIMSINGDAMANVREVRRRVAESKVGEALSVIALRNGKPMSVSITPRPYPNPAALQGPTGMAPKELPALPDFGMKLSTITPDLRAKLKLPADAKGVVVSGLTEGSEAWLRNVDVGDRVLQVTDTPVTAPGQIAAAQAAARAQQQKAMRVLFSGPQGVRWIAFWVRDNPQ